MTQVKPKSLEAYEYIQNYQGLINPNNFLSHKWLKDAKALIKVDAPAGWALKSYAYILAGHPQEALYAMQNAQKLGHVTADFNVAVILRAMGELEKSNLIALEYLQHNPQDNISANILLDNALSLLDLDLANKVMQLYQGDASLLNTKDIDNLHQRMAILDNANIPYQNFTTILKLIVRFLSDKYIGNLPTVIREGYTELGNYIEIKVFVDIDDEQCVILQDKLLDTLVDNLDYDSCKNILVNLVPERYFEQEHV